MVVGAGVDGRLSSGCTDSGRFVIGVLLSGVLDGSGVWVAEVRVRLVGIGVVWVPTERVCLMVGVWFPLSRRVPGGRVRGLMGWPSGGGLCCVDLGGGGAPVVLSGRRRGTWGRVPVGRLGARFFFNMSR